MPPDYHDLPTPRDSSITAGLMSPERLAECLQILDMSQIAVARRLDCSDRQLRRWLDGSYTVPPAVADWLEAVVANRRKHPDPEPPRLSDWKWASSRRLK